jgi:hypothetical protein
MMVDNGPKPDFGCERCWPPTADAAWAARRALAGGQELIDESHFHVMILACPRCTQRFVSVFTETIDWQDGDDPQYWTLLPVTEPEAVALAQQRKSLTATTLNSLGRGRRCLRRDYPKGAGPRNFWGTGISVAQPPVAADRAPRRPVRPLVETLETQ